VNTSMQDAALYEMPFEYVRRNVKGSREEVRSEERSTSRWWLHQRPRPEMWSAIGDKTRYIVSPRVTKHRIFAWTETATVPDSRLLVIARDDDYFFGVLHSRVHELWSLNTSPRHGVGNDPTYNAESCFETFPFPWSPGQEDQSDVRVIAIAKAARELNELREAWLNPPDISDVELTPGGPPAQSAGHGQKRTLTNLYNARPTWLDNAHRKLDAAVFAAYGWPSDLSDDEILARLLTLNLERAKSV
jgi:type II restriction/modification system DNA methylase subunit YeeA